MKRLLYTIMLCLISQTIYPVYFKHLGMREGLSQLSVMSIYQDEFGRMWFGTEEGLCVYNGNQIVSYKPSGLNAKRNHSNTDLLGNANFPITGDGGGNLFLVSDNKLLRFDLRLEQFSVLVPKEVGTVSFSDNRIWVGVKDSVMIWNSARGNMEHLLTVRGARIQSVLVDSKGEIWIGTQTGLYRYSGPEKPELIIPGEDIYTLFEDSRKNLWIGTRENGMYLINNKREICKFIHEEKNPNSLSSNYVRSFAEDNYGKILIGTFTGLNIYNPEQETFSVYAKSDLPGGLLRSSVFSVYKSRQGTIWIGTYYGGIHYFNPEMDIFSYYSANPEYKDCLSDPFVGRMVEDNDNNVWICTEGGGLNFFNRKTRQITHFLRKPGQNSISHNNLKGICFSPEREKLYIGTHMGGLSIYDIKGKTFRNIPYIRDESSGFGSDVVNHVELFEDRFLVMLTRAGVLKMNLDTEQVTTLFDDGEAYSATAFHIDSKSNIWLTRWGDIVRINMNDPSDRTSYSRNEYEHGQFPVISVLEDKKGRLFFGTRGSGLYMHHPGQDRFTHFNAEQNLLLSNYCYAIAQSIEGYIIVTGDKGLSLLDPDKQTLRSVELETSLPLSGINYGCGILVCKNGEVFVGGVNGMATYFEESLYLPQKEYQLYFSSLWINNEKIEPDASGGIIRESLPYVDRIRLKYYQNNLMFNFASNNYIATTTGTDREYKLSGFDEKWFPCNGNSISYTNLNPGKYTLFIREINPGIPWRTNVISMDIEIKAPLYATTGAYIFYGCLILLILYIVFRIKQSRLLLNASLEFERKEKARIEELNQEKLHFFSNISHEFRTPLTLIISQIELLIHNQKLAPYLYNKLLKIYKQSFQMQTLLTELLDFRRLEQGYSKLHVSEGNLVPFVREIYQSFTEVAARDKLTYDFHSSPDVITCWFDPVQMHKVVSNLLSNAFKFTKPSGTIEVSLEDTGTEIVLKIMDNGIGIGKSEMPRIFDRFYQSPHLAPDEKATVGSGIGLALVKTIVELHHGEVSVESKPGYGSIFIVELKKGRDHFSEDEIVDNTYRKGSERPSIPRIREFETRQEEDSLSVVANQERYTILIVEDNKELLELLTSLFSPYCRVIPAGNGREGLNLAHKEKPDIILSDIMMEEMSGTEMCSRIKNDSEVCHIPVVLLTAMNSQEKNIEGLNQGADAYISKPFDSKVLLAYCNSIVRNRAIIRETCSHMEAEGAMSSTISEKDQRFLDTVRRHISGKISDEMFDVDEIAREVGLSRSSFYVKFKSLTGMTPNDYVIDYKLKQSAIFLEKYPKMQVSEIAANLGFGSARYFSRCFKARYGSNPTEYRAMKE